MKTWYVELKRDEYFTREVQADSEEAAVDQVLLDAPGTPADWSVVLVQPGATGATVTTEAGAAGSWGPVDWPV